MESRPSFRVGAAGLDPRDWRLIEIVFKHSQYNRFDFVLVNLPTDGQLDLLIINTSDPAGVKAAAAVRAAGRKVPIIAAVARGAPSAARHAISIDRLTLQLLPILNRVVDLEYGGMAPGADHDGFAPTATMVTRGPPAEAADPAPAQEAGGFTRQGAGDHTVTRGPQAGPQHGPGGSPPHTASPGGLPPDRSAPGALTSERHGQAAMPPTAPVAASQQVAQPPLRTPVGPFAAGGSAGAAIPPSRVPTPVQPSAGPALQTSGQSAAHPGQSQPHGQPAAHPGQYSARPAYPSAATPARPASPVYPGAHGVNGAGSAGSAGSASGATGGTGATGATGAAPGAAARLAPASNLLPFPLTGAVDAQRAQRLHALVVDDSPTVRQQLTLALERMGMACEAAASAQAALERLAARHFDLALVDVIMPDMDGYKLTREIKRDKRYRQMPVIILTSKSSPFDLARGALAGCDSFLSKPVPLKALEAAVLKHLRKSLAIDDLSSLLRPLVIAPKAAPAGAPAPGAGTGRSSGSS